jgi:hypothetical protein
MSKPIPNDVFEEVVPIKAALTEPLGALAGGTSTKRHLHPKADVHIEAEDVDPLAPGYQRSLQQFTAKVAKHEAKLIKGFRSKSASFHQGRGSSSPQRGTRKFQSRKASEAWSC